MDSGYLLDSIFEREVDDVLPADSQESSAEGNRVSDHWGNEVTAYEMLRNCSKVVRFVSFPDPPKEN